MIHPDTEARKPDAAEAISALLEIPSYADMCGLYAVKILKWMGEAVDP